MKKSAFAASSSLLSACSVLSLGIGAQAASAQSAVKSDAADIVVTATRRAESVQDVPATVTAFSQQDLESRKIEGLDDLITQVPSLNVGKTFGSNMVTLRGISTNSTSGFEDPSVAIHVNGIYQPRAHALDIAQFDLERIEVLSGPQGTLYGRNATGGVINYILRRPTKETEAQFTANVGNYDSYGIRGYISGPINDKVGFRIAGIWDNRDKSVIENVAPGASNKFGNYYVAAIRGVLAFEPTDTLQIDVEGSFSSSRDLIYVTALAPARDPFWRTLFGTQTFAPRKLVSNLVPNNDSKTYAANATIRWDINDDVKLSSISAYQKYNNNFLIDGDISAGSLIELNQQFRSNTFTQELNLNVESFDNRLSSIFGAYYFHDKAFGASQLFGNFGSGPVVKFYEGISNTLKTRSIALFTDQTLKVTDRFRVIGGLRYNVDKKTTTNQLTSCGTPAPILETEQKFTSWTPKVGGQFDVTKDVMFYGTWQEGVKAGGVALGTCANAFKPEAIEGFEVGLKTQLFDNKVRLNIAGYWYDYGNLQVQQTLSTLGGFQVTNAASAKIKGIEGNLDAAITDRLRLNVGAMVQSAKYTDFVNCDDSTFIGACSGLDLRPANDPTRFQQLAGNWLNRAAPWSVNVGLQYTFDVAGGKLMLRGESYWTGRLHFSEFDGRTTQPSYGLQNAFLTYTPEGDKFKLRLFAKNIGNKNYFAHASFNSLPSQEQAIWGDPRTYGAEASVKF